MQSMSTIEYSNIKHTCSGRVNIDHLTKDTTTRERSPDEQQITLFLSQSIVKHNTQHMDISNEQIKDIEGNSNLKIDNCV